MGECCALLICKLHLVLKAQWFLWPFCPEVAVEDDFLEKGGGNSSYKTTFLRLFCLILRCRIHPRNTTGQPVCLVQSLSLKLT